MLPPLPPLKAFLAASARQALPTTLGTAGLRELGAGVLARAAFCARGSSAIYASKIKEVIDTLSAGDISEGQARTILYQTLDALGYTPEGGFPDDLTGEVPPAIRGTLQDLRSFRRMDLIVRTQLDLMTGAGQQMRGHEPDSLTLFPAWELVRYEGRRAPRFWGGREMGTEKAAATEEPRWTIAGGRLYAGRMVAFKGDPVWGELGSYDNFSDALGVDHPPFAFSSGMGWKPVSAEECEKLGVTGPNRETAEEWFASRPNILAGKLPLPAPRLSLEGVDPKLIEDFQAAMQATTPEGKPQIMEYQDILAREVAEANKAYLAKHPDYDPAYQGPGK